jgi:hypothetical protein
MHSFKWHLTYFVKLSYNFCWMPLSLLDPHMWHFQEVFVYQHNGGRSIMIFHSVKHVKWKGFHSLELQFMKYVRN